MSEELNKNEELTETKEKSLEEAKEDTRILRKVKRISEKYGFKYGIDDIADYIKEQKELEELRKSEPVAVEEVKEEKNEIPVVEHSEELKDKEHNTYHRFVAGEKVWFVDFNSKHENKTFESIVDLYKFRPTQGTIKEVILNDIVRYKLKENHNIYEEDMICKTYDEAYSKCEDLNNK